MNINCYILAGGKSSRMGEDKGLLILNKKPIVQHVIEEANKIFENIFIISNNLEYKKFGLPVIGDLVFNAGPAGGIYTALKHSNCEINFVVSCDMPFVTKNGFEFLINNLSEYEVVLPLHNEKIEPLFAIYSKKCSEFWKLELDKGVYKLQDIISKFNSLKLDVDTNSIFNVDFFFNINRKEDFDIAQKLI